jgi:DNA invertase Pin-like site-specific DNA recombinase
MSDTLKIQPTHLARRAYVYIRQSTETQVQVNCESTDRQYQLSQRAQLLGWADTQIQIIDEDLAHSGSGVVDRRGFTQMTQEVALGQVGLILCLEASRLARNNTEWYRLLDLCAVSNTLIGDTDGLYHPGLFNDRLLLGLKGTMAEAELHVLRARLDGGIRNKAKRGELRRGLPVGFVWGEADGEVLFHPDQAVTGALRTIFEKFAELSSARQVWLWFQSEDLKFPHASPNGQIQWVKPTYTAILNVLHNPVYAGAYVYGKSKCERYVDESGNVRKRIRRLPRDQWAVLIRDHHTGYTDWNTFEMNQDRLTRNTRPGPQQAGGAPREGCALLQGLARCGKCGRKLHVYYQGKNSTPGYYCGNSHVLNGRGVWCMRIGGVRIDKAVVERFLEAIDPVGMEAALEAQRLQESEHQSALTQFRLQVERVQYEAERAERSYQNVEPENRLVARSLESEWENKLKALEEAQAQLACKEQEQCFKLTTAQKEQIHTLGQDLRQVWDAPTTTDRDRKELLQTLLEEVTIKLRTDDNKAHLVLGWKTGAVSELEIEWKTPRMATVRTEEDTIELIRRLAEHHKDDVIAGVLNRQGKQTATGERFTASRVASLRRHWKIPVYKPPATLPKGELLTVQAAADELGLAASTLHRWLTDGFIGGEQVTPGAPWRIRMTKELREKFVAKAPKDYVTMPEAMRKLGVSRQTIMQRVKRKELPAVHVHRGKRKGLYIKVIDNNEQLFDETLSPNV